MGSDRKWQILGEGLSRQVRVIDLTEMVDDVLAGQIPDAVQERVDQSIVEVQRILKLNNYPVDTAEMQRYRNSLIERDIVAFPNALYSALFVTAYHFFEYDLHALCRIAGEDMGLAPQYAEFDKDRGIHRAKKYLRSVAQIAFPSAGSHWQRIVSYGKIRNLVAHNGGRLDSSRPARAIAPFIRANPLLGVDGNGHILFTRLFVVEAADTMHEFWLELSPVFDAGDAVTDQQTPGRSGN